MHSSPYWRGWLLAVLALGSLDEPALDKLAIDIGHINLAEKEKESLTL
jgi:hypothetical protein